MSILLAASTVFWSGAASAQIDCRQIFQDKADALVAPAGHRSETDIPKMRFMSFNVENFYAQTIDPKVIQMSRQWNQAPPTPKPMDKVAQIRDIIAQNNPDIMTVIEIADMNALQELLDDPRLKNVYQPYLIQGNDPRGINIGFLVKKDLPWLVNEVSHKDLMWTNPQNNHTAHLFSRDLPVLEFRRTSMDLKPLFVVIGNHAKAQTNMDGDPQSIEWRTQQYVVSAQIVKSYEDQKIPVIFQGDFNTDIRSAPEVAPLKPVLDDGLAIAPNAVPPDQRFTQGYYPHVGDPKYTQLDDVMVSDALKGSVAAANIVRYHDAQGNELPLPQNFQQRETMQPSDHWPVVLDLFTKLLFGGLN